MPCGDVAPINKNFHEVMSHIWRQPTSCASTSGWGTSGWGGFSYYVFHYGWGFEYTNLATK
jgi:hypothetical protein